MEMRELGKRDERVGSEEKRRPKKKKSSVSFLDWKECFSTFFLD